MLDDYTFGDSQASINLMSILRQPANTPYSRRIQRMLSKYIEATKALTIVLHKETRETALKLWRDRFKEQVEKSGFPTIVKTHINCVAVGYYRKRLKEGRGDERESEVCIRLPHRN